MVERQSPLTTLYVATVLVVDTVLVDTEVALTTALLAEGAVDTGEIGALRGGADATSSVADKGADIGAAAVVAPASPAPVAKPGRTSRAKPSTHPAKCPLRPPA